MKQPTLTGPQVARAAGVTYRRVDYWTHRGLLRPTDPAPGSGYCRRYPPASVPAAEVLDLFMGLRSMSDEDFTAIVGPVVAAVLEDGPVGTFELVPGVIVDVPRLLAGRRA